MPISGKPCWTCTAGFMNRVEEYHEPAQLSWIDGMEYGTMRKVVVSWVLCGLWFVWVLKSNIQCQCRVLLLLLTLLYLVVYTCELEVGGGVHGPPYFVTTIKVRCMYAESLTQKVAERARHSHRRGHTSTKF